MIQRNIIYNFLLLLLLGGKKRMKIKKDILFYYIYILWFYLNWKQKKYFKLFKKIF